MIDLVERLRADADYHKQVAGDCDCRPEDTVNWEHRITCLEAADEIARLREQLDNAMDLLGDVPGETLHDRLTRLIGWYMAFQVGVKTALIDENSR